MAKKKVYRLEVVFPFANMEQWRDRSQCVEKAIGDADGAGTDFGLRDMEFCGLTQLQAIRKKKKVLSLKIPGLEASYALQKR